MVDKEKPDATDKKSNDDESNEPAAEGSKKKKIIIIIIVAVVLICVGIGVSLMLLGGEEKVEKKAPKKVPNASMSIDYVYFPTEVMGVFYDKKGKRRYIRVTIVLMIENNKEAKKGFESNMPLLTSKALELIENEDFEELKTLKGKLNLRTKLFDDMKISLPEESSHLHEVLFSTYVMD